MKIRIRKKFTKSLNLKDIKYPVVSIGDRDYSVCIKNDVFIWINVDKIVKKDRKRLLKKYPFLNELKESK